MARLAEIDFRGKTVLDVGCWDGALSFEAEKLGARFVVATDSFVWKLPVLSGRRGFDLAHRLLGSKVRAREIDVLELCPNYVSIEQCGGRFDVVLFFGILYHMRHPLLALEKVRGVTVDGGMAIVEGHYRDHVGIERPVGIFLPGKELAGDPTNWWEFNRQAYRDLLLAAGFARVEEIGHSGNRVVFYAYA